MLSDAKLYLRNAWWLATFPGIAIFLTVLSINFGRLAARYLMCPFETGAVRFVILSDRGGEESRS